MLGGGGGAGGWGGGGVLGGGGGGGGARVIEELRKLALASGENLIDGRRKKLGVSSTHKSGLWKADTGGTGESGRTGTSIFHVPNRCPQVLIKRLMTRDASIL